MAISPSGFSDHHLLSSKLTFPYLQRRSAYWALNVRLLEDSFFNVFRMFWTSLYGRKNTFHSNLQWWDIVKIHIKIFCQQYKLHHSWDSLSMITILAKEVLELQRNPLELNINQGLRKEFISKKELLHSLVNERAKGDFERLKIKNLSLFDTSSKLFFSLERKTKTQQQLLSVQSPEGGIVSEPKMIKRIVVDYFSSLFCAKKIDLNVAKAFIEPLPKLSESQRASLESSITLEELGLALSSMASGKAPGLDGIPCEFYKTFWDIIGPELLEVLKESFQVGELPLSFRRAVVSLLPKKGDTQLLRNWRPVSLLTTDYKIF
uniref:Reverse transcriptase n=1 Tax=Eptatretus burgeri TaxID=7764 RepID=A0A8C4NJP1_EPTBU